jgi:hypothetical protein
MVECKHYHGGTMEKRITVIIPGDVHRAVKVKAAETGANVSDIVRALLAKWLAGELTTEIERRKEAG